MPLTSSSTSNLLHFARSIIQPCPSSLKIASRLSYCRERSSKSQKSSLQGDIKFWNSSFLSISSTGRRGFSSSFRRRDHYTTLGLPHTATKAQIKSHFYKMSKAYHPDVSKDPKAAEIFAKVSEAYSVLSNDRDRRAYDRSLLHRPPPTHATPSYHYTPRAAPNRGPRATYAWEFRRRSSPGSHPRTHEQGAGAAGGYYDPTRPPSQSAHKRPDGHPYASRGNRPPVYHDVLTGTRKREEEEAQVVDMIKRDSTVWRAVQLVGALSISAGIIYSFGAG